MRPASRTPTSKLLGQLRLTLAKKDGLLKPDEYAFTWVVDFPLLEWDPEEKRYVVDAPSVHVAARRGHRPLEHEPGAVRAKAYDLVLNGSEIGGGSIRIHDATMQSRIFSLLNISAEEAKLRFGFFLEALEYGTPPHGGIALGLDRIAAILAERELHPRGHRVSEDGGRRRPDVERAVAGRCEAAAGAAPADSQDVNPDLDTREERSPCRRKASRRCTAPTTPTSSTSSRCSTSTIRTQGDELIVEGDKADEAARRAHLRAADEPDRRRATSSATAT